MSLDSYSSKPKILFGVLITIGLILAGLVAVISCKGRDCYYVGEPPRSPLNARVREVYASPDEFAEQIFDGIEMYPDHTSVRTTRTAEGATVIIALTGLSDDSISGQKYRFDLVETQDGWMVDWYGSQFKCKRSLGIGWGKGLCP